MARKGKRKKIPKSRRKAVSRKISKVMKEGVRGKKVSRKQAIAVGIAMGVRKRKRRKR